MYFQAKPVFVCGYFLTLNYLKGKLFKFTCVIRYLIVVKKIKFLYLPLIYI